MNLRVLCVLIVVTALQACSAPKFDLENEFKKANKVYYEADRVAAENALNAFVREAERNEISARKNKGFDFDRVLAMSWLKLTSIYEIENNSIKAEDSMTQAIRYFDRVSPISSDPDYQKDKRQALRNFLKQSESYEKPEWKKRG